MFLLSRTLVLFLSALMFVTGIRTQQNLPFNALVETRPDKEQTNFLFSSSEDLVFILSLREEKVSSSPKNSQESEKKQLNSSIKSRNRGSAIIPPSRSQTDFCFPFIILSLRTSDLIFPFHYFW